MDGGTEHPKSIHFLFPLYHQIIHFLQINKDENIVRILKFIDN